MLTLLNRLDRLAARFEYGAMVFLMAALTLILVAQVLLRYFFASPIFWAEDVAVQILAVSTCLGISYLIYRNDMIKVDFLLAWLPEKAVRPLNRVILAVGLSAMLLVCFHAAEWLLRPENRLNTSPTTGLPRWYNHLAMVACFHLAAFHLFVKLLSPSVAAAPVAEEESC